MKRSDKRNWLFKEEDAVAAQSLAVGLPAMIFDVHAHLYSKDTLSIAPNNVFATGPDEVTPAVWRECLGRQVGCDRVSGALFIPVPMVARERITAVNAWVMQAAAEATGSKALALVTPDMKVAEVETLLRHGHFAGFKPYHTYSVTHPTFDALPGDYIPEWVWSLAHERGLVITLHLVRAGAMADVGNLRYLRDHCARFPGARLILAHCGRSFHAPNAAAGIAGLCDLPNVWFDTSAVCEAEPFRVLLESCGPRRLLWGSDFPISEQRGRCVTVGDGFVWVTPDALKLVQPICRLWPVGLESLRAFQTAARVFGLDAFDLQDVFADNAMRLLGLRPTSETRTQDLYPHDKSVHRVSGGKKGQP
ncbi:MAG: amidohydrolase family protein [bacterium]